MKCNGLGIEVTRACWKPTQMPANTYIGDILDELKDQSGESANTSQNTLLLLIYHLYWMGFRELAQQISCHELT